MWTSFAIALRILTSLPVSTLGSPSSTEIKRSIMCFPLVGAILGAVSGAVWVLGARLWPGQLLVASTLTMLVDMALTGSRGLGGVGRSADALFSLQEDGNRPNALSLLRDPRRNTPSVASMIVFALLKVSLLSSLRSETAWLSLIVVGCLGQWAVAFSFTLFRLLPAWNNADIDGTFAGAGMNEFIGAMALAIFGAAILPVRGLLCLGAIAVIVGPTARSISSAFNGLNVYFGYGLGFIAEIVALGLLAVRL